jgi:predicted SAM-dependent methyltransferase
MWKSVAKGALSPVYRRLPTGLRDAIATVATEWAVNRIHRAGRRKSAAYATRKHLRLNIGSGPNVKADWINVDLAPNADLTLDLREPMPLKDGCCSMIYSEHFFEHLLHPRDTTRFLSEAFRLLQPGGIFSVGVPDTEWPLTAYSNDKDNYFGTAARIFHPAKCKTKLDHINYHFRQDGEHKYAWDFETLKNALEDAGFRNCARRDFDPALDSESRILGTLYVDCVRP